MKPHSDLDIQAVLEMPPEAETAAQRRKQLLALPKRVVSCLETSSLNHHAARPAPAGHIWVCLLVRGSFGIGDCIIDSARASHIARKAAATRKAKRKPG